MGQLEDAIKYASGQQKEIKKLTEQRDTLLEALKEAKQDLDVCEWRCLSCNSDQEMTKTDLYKTIQKVIETCGE